MAQHRTDDKIKYDFLRIMQRKKEIPKTKIMYGANLNTYQMKKFFPYFLENKYIEYVPNQKRSRYSEFTNGYGQKLRLTQKGFDKIVYYKNIISRE